MSFGRTNRRLFALLPHTLYIAKVRKKYHLRSFTDGYLRTDAIARSDGKDRHTSKRGTTSASPRPPADATATADGATGTAFPGVEFAQNTPHPARADIVYPPATVADASPCASLEQLEFLFGLCHTAFPTHFHRLFLLSSGQAFHACRRLFSGHALHDT